MLKDHEQFWNLIGDHRVAARAGRTFLNRNPADGDNVVGVLPRSAAKDVEDAVVAARGSFRRWHRTPPPAKGEILLRAALIMEQRKEELARGMTREMGQALAFANSTSYGLSLSIYRSDINRAFRAMRELESGIVYINAPTIGAEIQTPFGGIKNTGNGHWEAGTAALDQFSEWKTIYVDYSGRLQKAQNID